MLQRSGIASFRTARQPAYPRSFGSFRAQAKRRVICLGLHVVNSSTPILTIPVVPSVDMVGNSIFTPLLGSLAHLELKLTCRQHVSVSAQQRLGTQFRTAPFVRDLHCAASHRLKNNFKISRFCPLLVSGQNYTEPPLSARFLLIALTGNHARIIAVRLSTVRAVRRPVHRRLCPNEHRLRHQGFGDLYTERSSASATRANPADALTRSVGSQRLNAWFT